MFISLFISYLLELVLLYNFPLRQLISWLSETIFSPSFSFSSLNIHWSLATFGGPEKKVYLACLQHYTVILLWYVIFLSHMDFNCFIIAVQILSPILIVESTKWACRGGPDSVPALGFPVKQVLRALSSRTSWLPTMNINSL